jgi:hypothetical protein
MPRLRPSWQFCRRGVAVLVVIALCVIGYRRGYNAQDDLYAGQTPVVVRHKVDDLMGPDFSASGMTNTADSLIALVNSLPLEDANRAVTFNASRASGNFSALEVTTFPYLHKAVEKLLNDIRKPTRS